MRVLLSLVLHLLTRPRSYDEVLQFLADQTRRCFFKRVFQRDEVQRLAITACHSRLTDALNVVNVGRTIHNVELPLNPTYSGFSSDESAQAGLRRKEAMQS